MEFGEDEDASQKLIKEECSLRYEWSVQNENQPVIFLTSDVEKIGVNVTSIQIEEGEDLRGLSNPSADLTVIVYSKKGREIGRHTKKITVFIEQRP